MNIIRVTTTGAGGYVSSPQISSFLGIQSLFFSATKMNFNFFYLAKNGEVHKTLLKSYEVIFELVLNRKNCINLLAINWGTKNNKLDPEHPVNKLVKDNYENIHEFSAYIPIYNFYRADDIKNFKALGYTPPFPAAYSFTSAKINKSTIKLHLPKRTFPNPCLLCDSYPNHQAGDCELLSSDRNNRVACPKGMRLNIPRNLL